MKMTNSVSLCELQQAGVGYCILHNEKIKDFGNERSGLEESRYARIISSEVIFTHNEDIKTDFGLMPQSYVQVPKISQVEIPAEVNSQGSETRAKRV